MPFPNLDELPNVYKVFDPWYATYDDAPPEGYKRVKLSEIKTDPTFYDKYEWLSNGIFSNGVFLRRDRDAISKS